MLVGTTKGLFTLRSGDGRRAGRAVRPDLRRRGGVRHVHRHPLGRHPAVHGSVSNHWGPVLRRSDDLGRDLDRGRAGGAAPSRATPRPRSLGSGSSHPGPADQPDVHLRRRRAGGAVPQRRRRAHLLAGARAVGPSPPAAVATRRRRAVPAHRARPSGRPRAAADRHLGGGRVPQSDDGGDDMAGQQPRHRRPASCPRARTSSSVSACTRWRATPATPSASTCSTTAASTAATTAGTRGSR